MMQWFLLYLILGENVMYIQSQFGIVVKVVA